MLDIHWFLPTGGDSRDVLPSGANPHRRAPDIGYLAQIATACDELGFGALLTPCGTGCEDAWLATAALLGVTKRIRFLVAFRPALLSPTLAAQMASTYQRISGGRLKINIVTGAEQAELARFGVWDDKDTRYERTGEFLEVMKSSWSDTPFNFTGAHYRVEGATTREIPDPIPEIYFGGASVAAEKVAAEQVDVYLAWGEPPAMVAERLDRVRSLATAAGRTLRFGPRPRHGQRPTVWSSAWTPNPWPRRRSTSPKRSRSVSADRPNSQPMRSGPSAWRSTRMSGPESAWCGAAWVPRS
jgi:alkanesulfonate monooxygenase